jgi:hypothetical protein
MKNFNNDDRSEKETCNHVERCKECRGMEDASRYIAYLDRVDLRHEHEYVESLMMVPLSYYVNNFVNLRFHVLKLLTELDSVMGAEISANEYIKSTIDLVKKILDLNEVKDALEKSYRDGTAIDSVDLPF